MKLEQRQMRLAWFAAAAVLLFAFDRIALTPLTQRWSRQAESIVQLRQLIENGRAVAEREDSIRERWETMRVRTLAADPSQAEQQLLQSFDQWSKESGIAVTSLKPQWKRGETDDYSLLECRVDASGSLENLTRFLYEVERSPLALRIQSVDLAARDGNGRELTLDLQVSGLRLAPLDNL